MPNSDRGEVESALCKSQGVLHYESSQSLLLPGTNTSLLSVFNKKQILIRRIYMGLTDRSRLSCFKHRQRKLYNQNRNLQVTSASEPASKPAKDLSAQEKAWNKYLYAKAIYQETKETDHWRYMQECLSDYEKALMAN